MEQIWKLFYSNKFLYFAHGDIIKSSNNYKLIDDFEVSLFSGKKVSINQPIYLSENEFVEDVVMLMAVNVITPPLTSLNFSETGLNFLYYDDA